MIKTKRIYESVSKDDGHRVFVDRLWPRGVSKKGLNAEWLKEIAPSVRLRIWFSHEESKWKNFKLQYKKELSEKKELIKYLKDLAEKDDLTLLYASKDTEHNEAIVLKEYLEAKK